MKKTLLWYHRINAELYYVVILNFFMILFNYQTFKQFWIIIELLILLLVFLLLMRKNTRLIYSMDFNDTNKSLTISYYQFIICKYTISIPYSQLRFSYKQKSYGAYNIMHVLILKKKSKSVAEIREKNNIGWTINDLMVIVDKLKTVTYERND